MRRNFFIQINIFILQIFIFFGLQSAMEIGAVEMGEIADYPVNSEQILLWEDIPQIAMTSDGLAKVIVAFHVPDFKNFSESLESILPPVPGQPETDRIRSNIALADAALKSAVDAAANRVLGRLPAPAYRINHRYWSLPLLALDVDDYALELLRADPEVKFIIADIPQRLPDPDISDDQKTPSNKGAASSSDYDQPAMADTISLIGADDVWDAGYSGSGWYVAILDTGIRVTHEFFQGKTIVEACFSADGHCPNGQTSMTGTGAAVHYPQEYNGYDHGTHVAGTAAGKRVNDTLHGVAKDADIMAIQVFSKFTAADCRDTPCVMSYASDQIAALEYVYGQRGNYNIGAVNMSLGGGSYSDYCDTLSQKAAIDNLASANIPTAIATGNDYYCRYICAPACISSAIAVMASTKSDADASFSNWHAEIADIFAPGVSIYSSTGSSDTSYAFWNGTSMATPHVAGGLTLMRQFRPTDSPAMHLARIKELGPAVNTKCAEGGSEKRIYLYNIPNTPVLSVSPSRRNVAKESGTTTFDVSNTGTGTMSWTAAVISGGEEWLSIPSGSSGTDSGTITCAFTANTGTSPRSGMIRVTSAGATCSPVDVTVTQAETPPGIFMITPILQLLLLD